MPVRRIAALLAVALAVLGAGYAAYWFHVADAARKGLQRWADDRRAHGWRVEWHDIEVAGFPGRLHLVLNAPSVAIPDGPSWRSDRVEASARPLSLDHLRLELAGRHEVAWPGGSATIDAAEAHALVNLTPDGDLDDATVLLSGLGMVGLGVPGLGAEPLRAAGMALTWDPLAVTRADHTVATVRFSATAHDVVLPPLPGLPLDRAVGLMEVTGRVLGALPDAAPAEALTRWAADGGTVELDHVSLEWPPMAVEAQGTMALDPAGRPLASLSTRMRGFSALMDRLADAGVLAGGTAAATKMALMLMARPDAKGRPTVPVPVTVQDGGLYLGPALVARLGRTGVN